MKQSSFEEFSELPRVRLIDIRVEVGRELKMRRELYPKYIEQGKIKKNEADWRIKVFKELEELILLLQKITYKYRDKL